MSNAMDELIEKCKKYTDSKYLYFYPADIDYLEEYFHTEINKDKITEIGNYILVPHKVIKPGEIVIGGEDIIKNGTLN